MEPPREDVQSLVIRSVGRPAADGNGVAVRVV